MELRHFECLVRIASAGSISGAAAELHITQPALSRQLAEMERELGVSLCVRNPRGVQLTEAGKAVHDHALFVLGQVEKLPELVRVTNTRQTLLRVGVPPGMPDQWFRTIVDAVRTAGLRVSFSLYEAGSDEQRQLLQGGLIDLALLHAEPHETNSKHVLTQPLGAAVPRYSKLAERDRIEPQDLDGLVVMAHAVGEIKLQEVKLRLVAEAAGVKTDWVFRKFSQHSILIAELAGADAALTTQASALRNFPSWSWIPLEVPFGSDHDLRVHTYAAWMDTAPDAVRRIVELMALVVGRSNQNEDLPLHDLQDSRA